MSIKTLSIYKSIDKPKIHIVTGVDNTNVYVDEITFDLITVSGKLTRVMTSHQYKEYGLQEFDKLILKGYLMLSQVDLIDLLSMVSDQSWTQEKVPVTRDPNPDPFKNWAKPDPEDEKFMPVDLSRPE